MFDSYTVFLLVALILWSVFSAVAGRIWRWLRPQSEPVKKSALRALVAGSISIAMGSFILIATPLVGTFGVEAVLGAAVFFCMGYLGIRRWRALSQAPDS